MTPYLPDIGGWGGIKIASASTPSANEPEDLILVYTVQLKPLIKAQISGRSDVVIASVHSEKTLLQKLRVR